MKESSTGMKKEALNVPKAPGGGPKYEQVAKGGDLARGLSHREPIPNNGDSIKQPMDGTTQRMPKGSDRI